jgi:hypothetical protein
MPLYLVLYNQNLKIFVGMIDMAMEHDRMHQLALKSGYDEGRYLFKLTKDNKICDKELRTYTELLIDDIFENIKHISSTRGLIDNHALREQIRNLYVREL